MTGRGVDQVLPTPSDPRLKESWVRDARDYVALAEMRNGPIIRPVRPEYLWGIALGVLDEFEPDARIVNLETSITTSEDDGPAKASTTGCIPRNVGYLTAARIDWLRAGQQPRPGLRLRGLAETLETLERAGAGHRVAPVTTSRSVRTGSCAAWEAAVSSCLRSAPRRAGSRASGRQRRDQPRRPSAPTTFRTSRQDRSAAGIAR